MATDSLIGRLPGELRDLIYYHVVFGEQPIHIKQIEHRKHLAKPVARSNIIFTCKQLKAEYLDVFSKTVSKFSNLIEFEAEVTNMDFAWLSTFFNLSPQTPSVATNHRVHIKLILAKGLDWEKTAMSSLRRWAKYCDETATVATYKVLDHGSEPAWKVESLLDSKLHLDDNRFDSLAPSEEEPKEMCSVRMAVADLWRAKAGPPRSLKKECAKRSAH